MLLTVEHSLKAVFHHEDAKPVQNKWARRHKILRRHTGDTAPSGPQSCTRRAWGQSETAGQRKIPSDGWGNYVVHRDIPRSKLGVLRAQQTLY